MKRKAVKEKINLSDIEAGMKSIFSAGGSPEQNRSLHKSIKEMCKIQHEIFTNFAKKSTKEVLC